MSDAPLARSQMLGYGIAGLALLLGLWSLLSITGLVPRQFLPAP
jgi:ABC-type nitrate/sulfonate/bicarbonate transport system permease component